MFHYGWCTRCKGGTIPAPFLRSTCAGIVDIADVTVDRMSRHSRADKTLFCFKSIYLFIHFYNTYNVCFNKQRPKTKEKRSEKKIITARNIPSIPECWNGSVARQVAPKRAFPPSLFMVSIYLTTHLYFINI